MIDLKSGTVLVLFYQIEHEMMNTCIGLHEVDKFVQNSDGKPRRRWKDSIEMYLEKTDCDKVN